MYRRLKGRGLLAMKDMVDLPIDRAQMIALKSGLETQIKKHQAVWNSLGGFSGFLDLHHNAACLIEVWEEITKHSGADPLDPIFYGLGFAVFLAALTAILNIPIRWLGRKRLPLVPNLFATFAVTLYAEIQVKLRTYCEANRPDLLGMIGNRI